MKKITLFLTVAMFVTPQLWANPFEDFKTFAVNSALKPFAKDFGGVIGATDFHSARLPDLGGFDIGAVGSVQFKPHKDNLALKSAGVSTFGLPAARIEVGLPFKFSVFARGLSASGASWFGGGARYQIYKSGLVIAVPDVALTAAYDSLSHDVVKLAHFGASAQASWNIPVLKPFFGVGFDSTKVTVKQSATAGLVGLDAKGTGSRVTAGAQMTPFPFTYLFGAYSLMNGQSGAQFGLGVKFGGVL